MKDGMIECSDVKDEVSEIASRLRELDFVPDFIVSISRGGMIPGRLLAARIDMKRMLHFGLDYSGEGGSLDIYSVPNPMPKNKKLLLVDDCLCTGAKLEKVKELCEAEGNECKTVAVFALKSAEKKPDIFLLEVDKQPRFPWTRREELVHQ